MKNELIRVSCVSYLNSVPFRYGLTQHPVKEKIQLLLDTPAECAARLRSGTADIGLVPVAIISSILNPSIISNWCIGADGPVKSVTLLSRVPLGKIKKIMLDYQSRTSVRLTQVLASEWWKINPLWIKAEPGFESMISGNTAAVVIGDRSLKLRDQFEYVYDLAEEWKNFTGLPFVFACWVSNRNLSKSFLDNFEEALSFGISHIDTVINQLAKDENYYPATAEYLKKYLSFSLDEEKKKGMQLFLSYLEKITPEIVSE